jgi:hypothetical protein
MNFIEYPKEPSTFTYGFVPVPEQDRVRDILCVIPSFDIALERINETDFLNYIFFVRAYREGTDNIAMYNLFFIRSYGFKVMFGPHTGQTIIPIEPIQVFMKPKPQLSYNENLEKQNMNWMSTIIYQLLKKRENTIIFTANDKELSVPVSNIVLEQLSIKNDCVPLMVLTTEENSLQFAKMTIDLLHSDKADIKQIIHENKNILKKLSVNMRRKMYDIFPEEFITIPKHMLYFFELIDKYYEYTQEDVEELQKKYTS